MKSGVGHLDGPSLPPSKKWRAKVGTLPPGFKIREIPKMSCACRSDRPSPQSGPVPGEDVAAWAQPLPFCPGAMSAREGRRHGNSKEAGGPEDAGFLAVAM